MKFSLLKLGVAAILLAGCNLAVSNESSGEVAASRKVVPAEAATDQPAATVVENEIASAAEVDPAPANAESESTLGNETPAALPANREGLVATAPTGQSLQPQLAKASIDLKDVVTLLPPDAIRAVNPEEVADIMVTAAEANAAGLEPEVRVMGVSINGQSQAYPIPFLSRHEIVNTEVGGRLVAVTW